MKLFCCDVFEEASSSDFPPPPPPPPSVLAISCTCFRLCASVCQLLQNDSPLLFSSLHSCGLTMFSFLSLCTFQTLTGTTSGRGVTLPTTCSAWWPSRWWRPTSPTSSSTRCCSWRPWASWPSSARPCWARRSSTATIRTSPQRAWGTNPNRWSSFVKFILAQGSRPPEKHVWNARSISPAECADLSHFISCNKLKYYRDLFFISSQVPHCCFSKYP